MVVPTALRDYAEWRITAQPAALPVSVLRNAPVDAELPELDPEEPVVSKYARKRTFVADGFLARFAELAGTQAIAHLNINHGDVFQEIYAKRSMAKSQTQKALGSIVFHKDLSNHFVQPDHLCMLGLRSAGSSQVWTTFASDRDVVIRLPHEALKVARAARFATPYKDIVIRGCTVSPPRPATHALLNRHDAFVLMEGLTKGVDAEAEEVLGLVLQVARQVQRGLDFQPGDFASVRNKYCCTRSKSRPWREPRISGLDGS